jgi:lipopolysaccharide biosynthesis glycosyltransferase
VAIAVSFNEAYLPHFSVLLASIIHHGHEENFYEIIALTSKIEEGKWHVLCSQIENLPNFALKRVDLSGQFEKPGSTRKYITAQAYYRLALPHICRKYEKLLYIDVDCVVNEDVAVLFHMDIEHYHAAACLDDLHVRYRDKTETGEGSYAEYYYKKFHVDSDFFKTYFNSGVMIFNIKEIRKSKIYELWFQLFWKDSYLYFDQDIFNFTLLGKVKLFDYQWNYIVPKAYLYDDARHKCIIHFAGVRKPWKQMMPLGHYYWKMARKSPFYEELLAALLRIIKPPNVPPVPRMPDFPPRKPGWVARLFAGFYRRGGSVARILEKSGYFDRSFYLAKYPEVHLTHLRPEMHYVTIGAGLGYDPAPWFSTAYYMEHNCKALRNGVNPFYHFITYGIYKGKLTRKK